MIRKVRDKDCLVPVPFYYDDDYRGPLSTLMASQTEGTIEIAAIIRPSFSPERSLFVTFESGLNTNFVKEKYRLYVVKAKESIWGMRNNEPAKKPDESSFSIVSIPLDSKTAEKLSNLWKSNIEAMSDDPIMDMFAGLDGTTYEFGIKGNGTYLRAEQMNCMIRQNILAMITDALIEKGDDLKPDEIPGIIDSCLEVKRKENERIAQGLTALPRDSYPDWVFEYDGKDENVSGGQDEKQGIQNGEKPKD